MRALTLAYYPSRCSRGAYAILPFGVERCLCCCGERDPLWSVGFDVRFACVLLSRFVSYMSLRLALIPFIQGGGEPFLEVFVRTCEGNVIWRSTSWRVRLIKTSEHLTESLGEGHLAVSLLADLVMTMTGCPPHSTIYLFRPHNVHLTPNLPGQHSHQQGYLCASCNSGG